MKCLKCNLDKIVKYGKTNYGKQRYKCKDCRGNLWKILDINLSVMKPKN